MRWCFEPHAGTGVHQELARGKNVSPVPGFCCVEKEVPLHDQEWNVQRIEEGERRKPAFKIGIQKREIATHWSMSISAVFLGHMSTEEIGGFRIQPQQEIILDGKCATCGATFYCPIQAGSGISRQSHSIIEFGGAAAEIRAPEYRPPRPEPFNMQAILVLPIDQLQTQFRVEPARIETIRKQLRQRSARITIPVFKSGTKLDAVMWNVFDMRAHRGCPVIELRKGLQFRPDRDRH